MMSNDVILFFVNFYHQIKLVEVLAAQDFDVMSIHEGSDYNLILDYDGKYMNATLEAMAKK